MIYELMILGISGVLTPRDRNDTRALALALLCQGYGVRVRVDGQLYDTGIYDDGAHQEVSLSERTPQGVVSHGQL